MYSIRKGENVPGEGRGGKGLEFFYLFTQAGEDSQIVLKKQRFRCYYCYCCWARERTKKSFAIPILCCAVGNSFPNSVLRIFRKVFCPLCTHREKYRCQRVWLEDDGILGGWYTKRVVQSTCILQTSFFFSNKYSVVRSQRVVVRQLEMSQQGYK